MSVLDPEWSESLDTAGRPRDPLGATRARNQVVDLYAHGLITENPFRMRYFSLFPWILSSLNDGTFSDEDYSEDLIIKRFEKIVALSSRYHYLAEDLPYEALRAVSGVLELRRLSAEDLERVDIDSFELQKNDGYGYQNYERALQKLLLKRGGYQLTGAGQEVAEVVDTELEPYADPIFQCIKSGEVTESDFEHFSRPVSIHAIHTYPDEFVDELRVLQKVLSGILRWDGDPLEGTTQLTDLPETFDNNFLHYLYDSLPDRQDTKQATDDTDADEDGGPPIENIPFENFNEHLHDFRRGTVLFLLMSWGYYLDDSGHVDLSDAVVGSFTDTRKLFLLYWLQIYAGYAIDAQLEAVTTFVNKFNPPRYPLSDLLSIPTPELVVDEATNVLTSLSTRRTEEEVGAQSFTRHLLLYDEALSSKLDVTMNEADHSPSSWGDLQRTAAEASKPPHELEAVNEVTIGKAIRKALDDLHRSDRDDALEPWGRSLGRSLGLLAYVNARIERLRKNDPDLFRLMEYQLGTRPGNSLPYVYRYLQAKSPDLPLDNLGRRLIEDRVIKVHENVMYTRLTPGNLQRLFSLDRDDAVCLRVDEDPHERPFRARPRFIRYDELSTLIRDCNLLTGSQDDGYKLTDAGREFLSRAYPDEEDVPG